LRKGSKEGAGAAALLTMNGAHGAHLGPRARIWSARGGREAGGETTAHACTHARMHARTHARTHLKRRRRGRGVDEGLRLHGAGAAPPPHAQPRLPGEGVLAGGRQALVRGGRPAGKGGCVQWRVDACVRVRVCVHVRVCVCVSVYVAVCGCVCV